MSDRGWIVRVMVAGLTLGFSNGGLGAVTYVKGSDGGAAHQFRNPCKVSVTTDRGLTVDRRLFLESRYYVFQVTAVAAPGWRAVRARYRNAQGTLVTLTAPISRNWSFSIARTLAVMGSSGIVSVDFETLRRTPSGAPDYTETIAVEAFVVEDLSRVDEDKDRLPDLWEMQFFGSLMARPEIDYDDDGATDLEEYENGTNPTDFWNGLPPVLSEVPRPVDGGLPSSTMDPPLAVVLTNNYGKVKPGEAISFAITSSSGGSLTNVQGITDAAGRARATLMLPGSTGTVVTVRARYTRNGVNTDYFIDSRVESTLSASPNAPGRPSVTMLAESTQALIEWEDRSFNEEGFSILRTNDNITWTTVAINLPPNTTSWTDPNVSPNRVYIYVIRAFNAAP